MGTDWKENLKNFFEEIGILEESRRETIEDFDQFCEFVAEPAFENLSEEITQYGVKTRIKKSKGTSISFLMDFTNSALDSIEYTIVLPESSVELRLKLTVRGKKVRKDAVEEKQRVFMEDVTPAGLLKLSKEEIIQDIIENCRNFGFKALAGSE
jgi:hypothetical protein